MGYLICQECGGYYKLEKGESEEDFISCECYGSLTYVNNIAGYLKENNKVDKHPSMNKTDKSTVTEILDLGQNSDNNGNDILGKEALQINSKTESFNFPSFNGSDSQRVKDRNYYRKINSKEKRPDIEKLKRIKDVRGIIEALDYKDSEVKLEAVKALGSIGDDRALKPLEKVKTVEKGVLKTYAQNAIFHIESKNRGLKSRNRAYYRNEFNNKSPSSKYNGNKSLNSNNENTNQTPCKSPKKTKQFFKNSEETSLDDSDTVKNGEVIPKVTDPDHSKPSSYPKTQENTTEHKLNSNGKLFKGDISLNKVNLSKGDKFVGEVKSFKGDESFTKSNGRNVLVNKDDLREDNGIGSEILSSKGVKTQKNVSKSNYGNIFSRSNTIPETKIKNNTKSHGLEVHIDPVLPANSTPSHKHNSSLFIPSSVVIGDMTRTTNGDNDEIIKEPSPKEVMDREYFIRFLGIKNTDKPLIGFIFLFAASLILGVLLTMGYN